MRIMRKSSLKLRLTLWYTVLMLIVSALVLTLVTSFSQNMMNRDAAERTVSAVDSMEMRLRVHQADRGVEPKFADDKAPGRRLEPPKFYDNGVHMVVLDENQNIIEGQIPFSITDDLDFENGVVRKKTYDGNQYFVYDKEVTLSNGNIAYVKGFISIEENRYAVMSVLRNNLILAVILILIAAVGGYFITSRALAPVSIMNKTAKSIIESKDLSQRINVGKAHDEISELAYTLDEMLCEIESSFAREQQFTSDASHELRTPIAVILTECEYMTDCADTVDELKSSAKSVKEEAQSMSKLVSELLTISRMDKETLKLNLEETELSELVEFVCDEQAEIHGEGITLAKDIAPDITARTDRFLIARLFINLVSNACKYTQSGGTVRVSLRENDNQVLFSVRDTGIGIAKENLSKIWERFYQVDPSRSENENGSVGLGLSMVKWIAEKHGGHIDVESEVGKGSTFTFIFPK